VRFVDTNVLLYAVSTDPGEAGKAALANQILSARDLTLSVQVLQEFYVQATRPGRADPLSHEQASALVNAFLRFPVVETTTALWLAAVAARHRFGLSHWDATVIEAARASGCELVLSEDLSDGQDYDGVRVEDPFAAV